MSKTRRTVSGYFILFEAIFICLLRTTPSNKTCTLIVKYDEFSSTIYNHSHIKFSRNLIKNVQSKIKKNDYKDFEW